MHTKRLYSVWDLLIVLGLTLTAAVAVYHFSDKRIMSDRNTVAKAGSMNLGQALWVSDWEMKTFYAPGTPTQKTVIKQLENSLKSSEFMVDDYILYRMGGSTSKDSNEGILLHGFDPSRPELARSLKAEPKQ